MTENEAIELHINENLHRIEVIEDFLATYSNPNDKECQKSISVLSKINGILQEFQRYRAVGTVEDIIKVVQFLSLDNDNGIIEDIGELTKYKLIGTVKECQEAMEKQRQKKPVKDGYGHDCCPECGWIVYTEEYGGRYLTHCENCGQAIDWSDNS